MDYDLLTEMFGGLMKGTIYRLSLQAFLPESRCSSGLRMELLSLVICCVIRQEASIRAAGSGPTFPQKSEKGCSVKDDSLS